MLKFQNADDNIVNGSQEYGFKTYKGSTFYLDSELKGQNLEQLQQLVDEIQMNFKKIHDYGTDAQLWKRGLAEVVIVHDQGYQGIFVYNFNNFCTEVMKIRGEKTIIKPK